MQISKILLSLLVAGLVLNSTVIVNKNVEPMTNSNIGIYTATNDQSSHTSCTDVCTIN